MEQKNSFSLWDLKSNNKLPTQKAGVRTAASAGQPLSLWTSRCISVLYACDPGYCWATESYSAKCGDFYQNHVFSIIAFSWTIPGPPVFRYIHSGKEQWLPSAWAVRWALGQAQPGGPCLWQAAAVQFLVPKDSRRQKGREMEQNPGSPRQRFLPKAPCSTGWGRGRWHMRFYRSWSHGQRHGVGGREHIETHFLAASWDPCPLKSLNLSWEHHRGDSMCCSRVGHATGWYWCDWGDSRLKAQPLPFPSPSHGKDPPTPAVPALAVLTCWTISSAFPG